MQPINTEPAFDADKYDPVKKQSLLGDEQVRKIATGVFLGLFVWSVFCGIVFGIFHLLT